MKKKYDNEACKRTIPDLELYTQLIGLIYGTLGLNLFLFLFDSKMAQNYSKKSFVLQYFFCKFM